MMEEQKKPDEEAEVRDQENREESESKPTETDTTGIDELQQKKVICAIAYIFGILFFLPLILYPNDRFARFHANQSLAILLVTIIGEVIFGILCGVLGGIAVLGALFGALCGIFGLVMLIACIVSILGVVKNEEKELPFLGKIKIIK